MGGQNIFKFAIFKKKKAEHGTTERNIKVKKKALWDIQMRLQLRDHPNIDYYHQVQKSIKVTATAP